MTYPFDEVPDVEVKYTPLPGMETARWKLPGEKEGSPGVPKSSFTGTDNQGNPQAPPSPHVFETIVPVSYTHLTLPTIYSV